MRIDRTTFLATMIVIGTGIVWGFYWLPVRRLTEMGLPGAWGTFAITAAATIVLTPYALLKRERLVRTSPFVLASIALGGAAFALYSIGFVYGRVAIIILLYFLTPVWSTLIARYVMGWHTPRLRIVAVAVGIAGLAIMLSANGDVPVPKNTGEWMALIAGILWSVATTGIRAKSTLEPVEAAFIFAVGATVTALLLAPFLEPWPGELAIGSLGKMIALAFATGCLWWGFSTASLMWATIRLEPARVGILLMTEVLVGAISAAILAGESLSPAEMIGGALVLCAGVLEVWPMQGSHSGQRHDRAG